MFPCKDKILHWFIQFILHKKEKLLQIAKVTIVFHDWIDNGRDYFSFRERFHSMLQHINKLFIQSGRSAII